MKVWRWIKRNTVPIISVIAQLAVTVLLGGCIFLNLRDARVAKAAGDMTKHHVAIIQAIAVGVIAACCAALWFYTANSGRRSRRELADTIERDHAARISLVNDMIRTARECGESAEFIRGLVEKRDHFADWCREKLKELRE